MKNIFLFFLLFFFQICSFAQYQIGHTTITFNDPTRSGGFGSGGGPGRQIQTEIYYPSFTAGENTAMATFPNFPVIVFGHGFAMDWTAYQNFWEHIVPSGYVMAFVRTEGSLIPAPSHDDFGMDLKLVGTKIIELDSNSNTLFYQNIKHKIVLMGHSMGGGASFLAAENNSSIHGLVGLAPAETNPTAIGISSQISVPALIFSGTNDGVTPPIDTHIPFFDSLGSQCKSFVSIVGGGHCYFANQNFNCDFGESTSSTGISISRSEQQEKTFAILDPWLRYILNSDCYALTDFHQAMNTTVGTNNTSTCDQTGPNATIYYDNLNILSTPTPGESYQWYANGFPMIGETNDTLIIPVCGGGVFSVSVFSANGCDTSNFITIQGGIQELTPEFQLSYNVLESEINIQFSITTNGKLQLVDLFGRELNSIDFEGEKATLFCDSNTSGLYYVHFQTTLGKRSKSIFIIK